jgi:signal recognition particle receptor subunit beta
LGYNICVRLIEFFCDIRSDKMVKFNENNEKFIKFVYWGCASSGKTTAIDTIYRLSQELPKSEVCPTAKINKIAMKSGATLYFDRGIFQSKNQKKTFYHIYTVAGQERFGPVRKKIFEGTDGIIFLFDGQKSRTEANINSLKELKRVAGGKLISQIPMVIMINKQDLPDTMKKGEVESILQKEDLFFEPGHSLYMWNPIVYETIATYENTLNIYQVFSELARRFTLYQVYGNGSAPDANNIIKLSHSMEESMI